MRRLLAAKEDGRTALKVVVIGGSMTAGSECDPRWRADAQAKKATLLNRTFGEHQSLCAWPARLGRHLTAAFGLQVSLVSLAKGAHSTTEWAAAFDRRDPELASADLIIAELSVNDQHIVDVSASRMHVLAASAVLFHNLLSLPQHPAVLALEAVRGAFASSARENLREVRAMCSENHPIDNQSSERLTPLGAKPSALDTRSSSDRCDLLTRPHIFVAAPSKPLHSNLAFGPGQVYRWCDHWWWPPSWRAPVLAALRVPSVSYRDATWPNRTSPPADLPYYWSGHSHPNGSTHQLLADTVAYALDATARRRARCMCV